MAIPITCSKCGKNFPVEDAFGGQEVQCPCGNTLKVPKKTGIPYPDYYRLGWLQFKLQTRQKLTRFPLETLADELLAYWGYLIAQEAEATGVARFSGIEAIYTEWQQVSQMVAAEVKAGKRAKLQLKLKKLSYAIAQHCHQAGYSFKQVSTIAIVEEQLTALQRTVQARKRSSLFWKLTDAQIPTFSRFSTIVAIVLAGATALVLIMAAIFLVPRALHTLSVLIPLGILAAIIAIPFLRKSFGKSRERGRLQRLWLYHTMPTGEAFIVPETVSKWLDAIYQKGWRAWRYTAAAEIIIPEDLGGGFIPDVSFDDNNPPKFGVEWNEEVEAWCQNLYKFCYESLTEPGKVHFCFVYSENLARIPVFLEHTWRGVAEFNTTQGEELIAVGKYTCNSPARLGVAIALLNELLVKDRFPGDRHFLTMCQMFDHLQLLLHVYEYRKVAHLTAEQVMTPAFVEIFAGLRDATYALAQRRPLLLIMEHLDYSDLLTLQLICSLTQGDRAHRLCFLVSYSRENVAKIPALKETILVLQKHNCWRTPEKEVAEHSLLEQLINKTKERDDLKYRLDRAMTLPTLQIVGIQGEACQGKSFVVQHFLDKCSADNTCVIFSHNYGLSAAHDTYVWAPFKRIISYFKENPTGIELTMVRRIQALAEVLDSSLRESQVKEHGFSWATSAGKALLEKLSTFDKTNMSDCDIVLEQKQRLWQEIAEILAYLAGCKPLVIFFDDFHLADTATIEFVQHLSANPMAVPILIIFTWDKTQLGNMQLVFKEFLGNLKNNNCYMEHHLSPLSANALTAFIAEGLKPNLLAESSQSPFIKKLMEISKGNALMVSEFCKWLLLTKWLYPFCGFWVQKEDLTAPPLTVRNLMEKFLATQDSGHQKLISAAMREASVYGDPFPLEYIENHLQAVGINPEDTRKVFDKIIPDSILLQSTAQPGYLAFVHPEYRQAVYSGIPSDQKKDMHRQVLNYYLQQSSKNYAQLLFHAESSQSWEQVLEFAHQVGRYCLSLFELSTAATLFEKGIAAARNLENLPALAEYYLLMSQTFPSAQAKVTTESLKTALGRKQWGLATELSQKVADKETVCELLLSFLIGLEKKERDQIAKIAAQLLGSLPEIGSEYKRIDLLDRLIPLFVNADPLQLRSLVEQSLNVIDQIYDIDARGRLYLLLQKQLGEMDLDLSRVISTHISPITSGAEKAISIYYLAAFLPKNIGILSPLLEETEEIANRVYQIMAFRGITEYLLPVSAQKGIEVLTKAVQSLLDISTPPRRLEAMQAFFTGTYTGINQKDFDKLVMLMPENARLPIVHSLFDILQQTPEAAGRVMCLNRVAVSLLKMTPEEELEKAVQEILQEYQKVTKPLERGEGFLEIAGVIIQENIHMAQQYLEEGIQEIEKVYESPDAQNLAMAAEETVYRMLSKIMPLLHKLPKTLVYPLWDRMIQITQWISSRSRDPLLCEMTVSLFSYDQDKAMQLAIQIESAEYRQKTVARLLALPAKSLNLELFEQVILKQAPEMYGYILLQEMAEKDLGRARRLLRSMPDSLETKIASARFFRQPGQRIRELLNLAQWSAGPEDMVQKITEAMVSLLRKKEYDREGNLAIGDMIPDTYPGKVSLLVALVVATQEVDPALAGDTFMRVPALLERYAWEYGQDSEVFQRELAVTRQALEELTPVFIETYVQKMLPALDVFADTNLKIVFTKTLCQKLKQISLEAFLEVVEKVSDPQVRFQLLEGLEKSRLEGKKAARLTPGSVPIGEVQALIPLSISEELTAHGLNFQQLLQESILSCQDAQVRMEFWIKTAGVAGNWNESLCQQAFHKALEEARKVPPEEISGYSRLLRTFLGLPARLRNDFVTRLIDSLTGIDPVCEKAPLSLCQEHRYFWNALRFLHTMIPFGPSHVHSLATKLLSVPKNKGDFNSTMECMQKFLFMSRGLCVEKESEWIAEAIGYLDNIAEETNTAIGQEDFSLLRALNMVTLAQDLIVYQPQRALRSAQRVLQLTEYAPRRYRFHRYILVKLSALLDYVEKTIQQQNSEAALPIKIMRLQCAYAHLQALKEMSADDRRKVLQEEKNIFKETISYVLSYLDGSLPALDIGELEEGFVASHQQLKEELEGAFQKLLVAKPGPGLIQAFFIVAQSVCLIDEETLRDWPTPWFHRLVRVAGRIDASKLSLAGDDALKADEREEFTLLVRRASLIFPRSVLLLIKSMMGAEEISEIPSDLEAATLSAETLKTLIPPLESSFLRHYRDRLLSDLAIEWVEYNWKDACLLISMISDPDLFATTLGRTVRKSCDYYPQEILDICTRAYALLQKIKNSHAKAICQAEVAVHIVHKDVAQALEIVGTISPSEMQVETLERIMSRMQNDEAISFIRQIAISQFKVVCLRTLLCRLPEESEERLRQIEQVWEMAQAIREDEQRLVVLQALLLTGIRSQDVEQDAQKIGNLLLDIWENASRMEKEKAFTAIAATFPAFSKLCEPEIVQALLEKLAQPEYLSLLQTIKK